MDPAHNTMERAMSRHAFAIFLMTQRFALIDLRETSLTQAVAPLIFR
jgi:hypothetical protein